VLWSVVHLLQLTLDTQSLFSCIVFSWHWLHNHYCHKLICRALVTAATGYTTITATSRSVVHWLQQTHGPQTQSLLPQLICRRSDTGYTISTVMSRSVTILVAAANGYTIIPAPWLHLTLAILIAQEWLLLLFAPNCNYCLHSHCLYYIQLLLPFL